MNRSSYRGRVEELNFICIEIRRAKLYRQKFIIVFKNLTDTTHDQLSFIPYKHVLFFLVFTTAQHEKESHSSSFDEDLSEAGSGKTRDSSEGPINEELTGDQLLLNLLFLFPDADSSFMSSSALEVELLNSHFNVIHTWCMRFLRPIRNSIEIHSLSRHFGFPSPTSLVHRLAVLLANLVDSPNSSDPTQQMMRMFDEFLSDLDNRVQRRIGLPDQSSYVEAEEAVSVQIEVDSARIIPIKSTIFEQKQLNTWLPVVSPTQPFSEWPQSARLNLALVFERLDQCIRTGTREGNQPPGFVDHLTSPTSQIDDDEDDETLFADAVEEQPNGSDIADGDTDTSNGNSPTGIHLHPYTSGVYSASSAQEAKHILSWLRSLDSTRLLRSLLPSICLEALITLHGMVPQDQNMITLLSEAFGQLENQIYHLLNRIQPDRGTLDSYTDYEQRFTSTLADIFTLIEEMCERVTCLYELLEYCASNLRIETSDLDRDFLFRLSMNALCIADCWTNEISQIKWTSIPSNMGEDRKCFLTEFKKLFGRIREPDNHQNPLGSVDILEPFRFVSNTPRWFPKHARLSLSEPDVSTYVLYSNVGQPNPVESRAGSQRLYVEAHHLPHPESVLLAGAFSRDTQFF